MEPVKKRLNNDERQGVMTLDMLTRSFDAAMGFLDRRFADYKYLKRDLGLLKSALHSLLNHLAKTVDADSIEVCRRQSRDYRIGIERWTPVKRPSEIGMSAEEEHMLFRLALEERCKTCLKSGREYKECELRRLCLKYLEVPEDEGIYEGCEFAGYEINPAPERYNKPKEL